MNRRVRAKISEEASLRATVRVLHSFICHTPETAALGCCRCCIVNLYVFILFVNSFHVREKYISWLTVLVRLRIEINGAAAKVIVMPGVEKAEALFRQKVMKYVRYTKGEGIRDVFKLKC